MSDECAFFSLLSVMAECKKCLTDEYFGVVCMYVHVQKMNVMLVFLPSCSPGLFALHPSSHAPGTSIDDVFLSPFLSFVLVILHPRNYQPGLYCNSPFGMLVAGIPRMTQDDVLNAINRVAVCQWSSGTSSRK